MTDDPFEGIAAAPPRLSPGDAERLARKFYDVEATASPLVSERDQNFLLTAPGGERSILKISGAAEAEVATDFQVGALLHIAARGGVKAPAIIPTVTGQPSFRHTHAGEEHTVRLVEYLPGTPLADTTVTAREAASLGRELARLDTALAGFSHPGEDQVLLWDMRRAPSLRRLLEHIDDRSERALVAATLDEFETQALPLFDSLPWQVIHNDANPSNVLVGESGYVTGIIDFGDMLRLPRIVELGVAGSYLRDLAGNPMALIEALCNGYAEVSPLLDRELDVLPLLVMTRLATTVAILDWRRALRGPGDDYLESIGASEHSAAPFLARLRDR